MEQEQNTYLVQVPVILDSEDLNQLVNGWIVCSAINLVNNGDGTFSLAVWLGELAALEAKLKEQTEQTGEEEPQEVQE